MSTRWSHAPESHGYVVPEQDGGDSIAGENAVSADMWIRKEDVGDISAAIHALAVPLENARTGSVDVVPMAREERHHLVVPRHMLGMREQMGSTPLLFTHLVDGAREGVFVDGITPRPQQIEAWQALAGTSNGILNLACGLGKTVLGLKRIALSGGPAVVIVNNTGLLEQWKLRAEEHLGLASSDIGIVKGTKAQWDRPLVIAMIKTLAGAAPDLPIDIRRRFQTAVYDETHHLAARVFLRTANLFYGDRIGLTATAEREDGLEGVYYAHLGGIFHTDLRGDVPAKVFFQQMPTELGRTPDIYDTTGEVSLGKLHIAMATLPSRNDAIVQIVGQSLLAGRKVLALTHAAEHPDLLKSLFESSKYGKRFTAGAISGKTGGSQRTQMLGDCDVTFATFGVAREGLDERTLDTVFFLTPFKAWGGFQQGKGRAERSSPGKKPPIAIVLEDVRIPMARALCASLRKKARQNEVAVTTRK